MARKKYRNITLKIDPYLYDGLEDLIKAHNKEYTPSTGQKRLYKVRIIEDLLFTSLGGTGWLGDMDSKKNTEYRRKMEERRNYSLILSSVGDSLPKKKRNRKK